MSLGRNPALNDTKDIELNEEFNNFMQRVSEVSNLIQDMGSGDKVKAEAAKILADQYLDGKIIVDEDVKLKVKENRTVINDKALKMLGNKDEVRRRIWVSFIFLTTRFKNRIISYLYHPSRNKNKSPSFKASVFKDSGSELRINRF